MTCTLSNAAVRSIFQTFAELNPHPKGELNYSNPYTLLVAVALSAQMTDTGVNKATKPLFEAVQTPEQMVAFGEENLREAIKSINLYKTKAKNVMALSHLLIERHGGQVPNSQTALEALPGVGRKTANVVRNIAFGEPVVAVDTHIFRVAERLGLSHGTTREKVADELEHVIPKEFLHDAHHWLILHGRYICVARKPKCELCPVSAWCDYFQTVVQKG